MACKSCKQKNIEKFKEIEKGLEPYDKFLFSVIAIILSLSLYGLFSLISSFFK